MNPEKTAPPDDSEPVEVVDGRGRPLAVVSAWEAHRQSLPHRAALVLFFNREGRLILTKRHSDSAAYPGRFDLTARGHIKPGEAALDAALRLAELSFPGSLGPLVFHRRLPPTQGTGFEAVDVFRCRLTENPPLAAGSGATPTPETLAAGPEELAVLAVDFRELFAPEVIDAFESGVLFRERG